MAGRSVSEMLGNRGLGTPATPGTRANPAWSPTPNAEPAGALTGAPPRTQSYSRQVVPYAAIAEGRVKAKTLLVVSEPTNRIAFLIGPAVGFSVFIGDASVTPANGFRIPAGQPFEYPLPGLQDLYAVTDAPCYVPVSIVISIILAAEQQRKLGDGR